MKKQILALGSVIVTLLFVLYGPSVPHNENNKQFESDTLNNVQNVHVGEITQIEEKSEQKLQIEEESAAEPKVHKEDTPESLTCTLTVKCDTILNNLDKLDEQKAEKIPENGMIYYAEDVQFFEGESVFNVVLREMKQHGIQFEFEITPIYDTAYIRGIANIYEFDCGELSGWIYKVNGQIPNVGCSLYYVSRGDDIEIMYTCEMGKDLG